MDGRLKYTLGTAGLWLFYRLFLVIFRLCMLCCGCDKRASQRPLPHCFLTFRTVAGADAFRSFYADAFSSKLTLYLREWPSRDLEEFDANFIPVSVAIQVVAIPAPHEAHHELSL